MRSSVLYDRDGFIERGCLLCGHTFRIRAKDWIDVIEGHNAFCPRCGEGSRYDKWLTLCQAGLEYEARFLDEGDGEDVVGLIGFDGSTKPFEGERFMSERLLRLYYDRADEAVNESLCPCCGTVIYVEDFSFICPCCGYENAVKPFIYALSNAKTYLCNVKSSVGEGLNDEQGMECLRFVCRTVIANLSRGLDRFSRRIYSTVNVGEPSRSRLAKPSKLLRALERAYGCHLLGKDDAELIDRLIKNSDKASYDDTLRLIDAIKRFALGIADKIIE